MTCSLKDVKGSKPVNNVVIVGMGALGMLFGQRIREELGDERFCFLVDKERRERYASQVFKINGQPVSFRILTPDEVKEPADLVMVATKAGGLLTAREMIKSCVGPDTTIISIINGISSEQILAEVYPREQIIDCIALGMDAVREGSELIYQIPGRLQIGSSVEGQEDRLKALDEFLTRAGIPHEVCPDITRAIWNKFMINVGINQTCMVHETDYGGATAPGSAALADMDAAMHEAMAVAKAEGIHLTEEDYEKDLALLRSLTPEGTPSMRQDALAGRPSEVEIFAGTLLRLAAKHNLEVPVNRRYYERIKEMERAIGRS